MPKDHLTTENLRKLFKNNFELCNFAIQIGREDVMSNTQMTLGDILCDIEERAIARNQS